MRPAHPFLMKDRSKRPFCFLLVLGCASLCGVSAAQSAKTDVEPNSGTTQHISANGSREGGRTRTRRSKVCKGEDVEDAGTIAGEQ